MSHEDSLDTRTISKNSYPETNEYINNFSFRFELVFRNHVPGIDLLHLSARNFIQLLT